MRWFELSGVVRCVSCNDIDVLREHVLQLVCDQTLYCMLLHNVKAVRKMIEVESELFPDDTDLYDEAGRPFMQVIRLSQEQLDVELNPPLALLVVLNRERCPMDKVSMMLSEATTEPVDIEANFRNRPYGVFICGTGHVQGTELANAFGKLLCAGLDDNTSFSVKSVQPFSAN